MKKLTKRHDNNKHEAHTEESPDEVSAEEIAQEKEPEVEPSDQDDHDSVISKTRKELEELDDLEV